MTEWKLFWWGSTRQYILISKEKELMQIKLIWNIRDGKKTADLLHAFEMPWLISPFNLKSD